MASDPTHCTFKEYASAFLRVKSETDESDFPPAVWHSLLLLFVSVATKNKNEKKQKSTKVINHKQTWRI